jgi:hypothetical protein
MVSYDTTQIALFVSLVLTIAAIGAALVLGVLAQSLVRRWSTRPVRPSAPRKFHVRLALHH